MSALVEPAETREGNAEPRGRVSNIVIPLLPLLACFLGGATQKWSEGVIIAVLGAYLLFRPPRLSLGWPTHVVLLALIGFSAASFLPAGWFPIPAWRAALSEDLGISIGQRVTVQPWMTATALVSLVAGICWFYRAATINLDLRGVRFIMRVFVSGVVLLAVLSIALYWAHASFSFWINERGFGPFPNRNQTADLFGIGAVVLLACTQDDFRAGRIRWVLGVFGLAVLLGAIILNFSRAGVAIFVGGSFLWVIAVALRKRSAAGIALGISLLLILIAAVLLLGGRTLERFQQWGASGPGISSDFRWKIWHDTMALVQASPWCGIGLGNFSPVFAMFRKESIADLTVLHPESDWMWLWSEAGWPAVALVLLAAILVLKRVLPLQEGTNQRIRLAALIGAVIFAVHGMFDVSGHRVGTAYTGLFLLGMALYRPLELKPSRAVKLFFRVTGVVLLVIGATWAATARSKLLVPGGAGVASVKRLVTAAYETRDFDQTIALTTHAVDWAPMDWELYFRRALAEAGKGKTAAALSDFRRARFLEPVAFELPRDEGTAWLATQPTLAATAWRDALRKAGRKRPEVFASMLTAASLRSPQVGRILEEFGLNEPDLALAYLGRLTGPSLRDGIVKLLQKDPNLRTLTDPQKRALFDLWSERGDLEQLAKAIEMHPDWLNYAWFGIAKFSAAKGDFRTAYDLTQRFGDAVAMPRTSPSGSLQELQTRYASNRDSLTAGFGLYQAQLQSGRVDDALNTARHFSERSTSPPYFRYLEAQSWAAKQNWERAWNAWLAYQEAASKK